MALFAKKLHNIIARLETEYELLAQDYSKYVQGAADSLEEAAETLSAEMARANSNLTQARAQALNEKSYLLGKIDALNRWEKRHNHLAMGHDWRIGGKVSVHGREPMLQMECAGCPARAIVPEGFFESIV